MTFTIHLAWSWSWWSFAAGVMSGLGVFAFGYGLLVSTVGGRR